METKTRKTRNIYTEINNGEELANQLINKGYDCMVIYGTLQDNYVFYIGKELTLNGGKAPRDYWIIKENYLNSWSSNHVVIQTDDDEIYNSCMELYDEQENY